MRQRNESCCAATLSCEASICQSDDRRFQRIKKPHVVDAPVEVLGLQMQDEDEQSSSQAPESEGYNDPVCLADQPDRTSSGTGACGAEASTHVCGLCERILCYSSCDGSSRLLESAWLCSYRVCYQDRASASSRTIYLPLTICSSTKPICANLTDGGCC